MSRVVIDASVALKWYLHEPFSEEALLWARAENEILVPELIYAQVCGALWRRIRAGELKREDGQRIVANLRRLPLLTHSTSELAPSALEIASVTARTFNESIYFALAIRENTQLVTADRRWFTLLSTGSMRPHLRWVGEPYSQ